MRCLTGDDHLDMDFATEWPEYDLDERTRALLTYAAKLTESPAQVAEEDLDGLREAGWDEEGVYRATALISFFNYSGRLESASGLPPAGRQSAGRLPPVPGGRLRPPRWWDR